MEGCAVDARPPGHCLGGLFTAGWRRVISSTRRGAGEPRLPCSIAVSARRQNRRVGRRDARSKDAAARATRPPPRSARLSASGMIGTAGAEGPEGAGGASPAGGAGGGGGNGGGG